ncbi:hypothetical protein ACSIDX_001038 [Campylobacter lari]|nr:hypothetical protein [Campylobacter lari]
MFTCYYCDTLCFSFRKNIKQNTIFEQKCKAGVFEVEVKVKNNDYFVTIVYDEIEFLNKLNQKEIEILTNLHKYKSSNIKDTFSFYVKQGKTIGREGKVFCGIFP